jgi:thymidylate kinase
MAKQQVICLEGAVGVGKTTQIERLRVSLSPDCDVIYELNGYSPMKEAIEVWKNRMREREEVYGFDRQDVIDLAYARAETQKRLLGQTMKPRVLMDRGIYTSMAFESGRVELDEVEKINIKAGVIIPDQCVILECDVEESLRRVDERRIRVGKYSQRAPHENAETIQRIREAYRYIATTRKGVHLVNSDTTPEMLTARIIEALGI